jgi:hypothetical protein
MPERYRNLIPVSKGNRGNKKLELLAVYIVLTYVRI